MPKFNCDILGDFQTLCDCGSCKCQLYDRDIEAKLYRGQESYEKNR